MNILTTATPMADLLIKNGRVISPSDGLDEELDVLISGGVIRRIGHRLTADATKVLDAEGHIVAPGFVDLHVHLREPGNLDSETLESGLRAAVAGGFTAVCPMPNTRPVNDQPELTRAMIEKASKLGLARVYPIAAATVGSEGEWLTDFAELCRAGAVAFSDDGRPIKTQALVREALREARRLGVPIIEHSEDPALSAGGVINSGAIAERLHLPGIPNHSEEACVARDIEACAQEDGTLHIAHLSTAEALAQVRRAKQHGLRVTCEVTPHHLALTENDVLRHGTNAKMNPPLRSEADREALWSGLADGTVDAVATDHAPHAPEWKASTMEAAPFGVIGLETAVAVVLRHLVQTGRISLTRMIELFTLGPARVIRQPLGRLAENQPADLTIMDPNLEWTYRAEQGFSKSRNSPFDGCRFRGAVRWTIVAGNIVHEHC